MKTWIRVVALSAAVLSIPLLGAAGQRPIGQRLSDREASTLRGGCAGADYVNCPGAPGPGCPASRYVTTGHGTSQNPTGDVYCGSGNGSCSNCSTGTVDCGG
jgi:hypothetical protein